MSHIVLVLNPQCSNVFGGHSLACLNALWMDAGCIANGTGSPGFYTPARLLQVSMLNLR